MKKAREFQKNICSTEDAKGFDRGDYNSVDREHLPKGLSLKYSAPGARGAGLLPMTSVLNFGGAPFTPQ